MEKSFWESQKVAWILILTKARTTRHVFSSEFDNIFQNSFLYKTTRLLLQFIGHRAGEIAAHGQ